ncbi:hypothetical protein MTO96_021370 [Rhipicephalus appendiculatus]
MLSTFGAAVIRGDPERSSPVLHQHWMARGPPRLTGSTWRSRDIPSWPRPPCLPLLPASSWTSSCHDIPPPLRRAELKK